MKRDSKEKLESQNNFLIFTPNKRFFFGLWSHIFCRLVAFSLMPVSVLVSCTQMHSPHRPNSCAGTQHCVPTVGDCPVSPLFNHHCRHCHGYHHYHYWRQPLVPATCHYPVVFFQVKIDGIARARAAKVSSMATQAKCVSSSKTPIKALIEAKERRDNPLKFVTREFALHCCTIHQSTFAFLNAVWHFWHNDLLQLASNATLTERVTDSPRDGHTDTQRRTSGQTDGAYDAHTDTRRETDTHYSRTYCTTNLWTQRTTWSWKASKR